MPRCDVAIATRNPKAYYVLTNLIRRMKLRFCSCAPGEDQCFTAKVVVTTTAEADEINRNNVIMVDEHPDRLKAEIAIMAQYLRVEIPSQVIIGIDPGFRNGLALLVDGNILLTRTVVSPIKVVELTLEFLEILNKMFPDIPSIVRIGDGSRLYMILLLRGFDRRNTEVHIELVDEKNTTVPRGYETNESSAVLIAMRLGREPLPSDNNIELKAGNILTIQQLYKRISEDGNELGFDEAKAILQGTIDLENVL